MRTNFSSRTAARQRREGERRMLRYRVGRAGDAESLDDVESEYREQEYERLYGEQEDRS